MRKKKKSSKLNYNVLFLVLFLVAFFYGHFDSQILSEQSSEKGNNALFQVGLAFFCFIYTHAQKIKIIIPNYYLFISYLGLLFILSLCRNNVIEDLRGITSILLTQYIVLSLSMVFHRLKFSDTLLILVVHFTIILFICVYVHTQYVGIISFTERKMYNRLGGLFFYGLTGVMAGLTAVLSSIGFYLEKRKSRRVIFGFCLLLGLFGTIGSDLRNAMAAAAICVIYLFYKASQRKRSMKLVFVITSILIVLVGNNYMRYSQAANNTTEDVEIREKIWIVSLNGIKSKPLTGYGKNNYFSLSKEGMLLSEELSDSHSSILSLMLTYGIPAAILFFIFYIKFVLYYLNHDKSLRGILIIIPIYWILATITGGVFFNGTGYYGSYLFGLSMFGILLHPQVIGSSMRPCLRKQVNY